MMLEVRRKPGNLLGHLPVPDNYKDLRGVRYALPSEPYATYVGPPGGVQFSQLELPIAGFWKLDPSGRQLHYLVLKSEDTPIETLRKISGFVEATQ